MGKQIGQWGTPLRAAGSATPPRSCLLMRTRMPTDSIGLGSRLPLFLALSFRVCVPPTRSPKPVVRRCRRRWSLPIISTHLARLSRHPIACDGSANFPIQFLVKSFSHQFHVDNLRNFSQFFGSLSCHVHPTSADVQSACRVSATVRRRRHRGLRARRGRRRRGPTAVPRGQGRHPGRVQSLHFRHELEGRVVRFSSNARSLLCVLSSPIAVNTYGRCCRPRLGLSVWPRPHEP